MQSSGLERLTFVAVSLFPQVGRATRLTFKLQKAVLPEGASVAILGVGVQSLEAAGGTQLANTA